MATNEEWLRRAIEMIDADVFNGDLDLLNHPYQIIWGRCPGKKDSECIQPSEAENISLDDFFPTTISVNYTIRDVEKLLEVLTLECIHAFFNEKSSSTKRFKQLASQYYFDAPFSSCNPSMHLKEILRDIYKKMEKSYGKFPGIPVKFPEKTQKEKKRTQFTVFCPECGYEMTVKAKIFDKFGRLTPNCPACNMKMGVDCEDESNEEATETN